MPEVPPWKREAERRIQEEIARSAGPAPASQPAQTELASPIQDTDPPWKREAARRIDEEIQRTGGTPPAAIQAPEAAPVQRLTPEVQRRDGETIDSLPLEEVSLPAVAGGGTNQPSGPAFEGDLLTGERFQGQAELIRSDTSKTPEDRAGEIVALAVKNEIIPFDFAGEYFKDQIKALRVRELPFDQQVRLQQAADNPYFPSGERPSTTEIYAREFGGPFLDIFGGSTIRAASAVSGAAGGPTTDFADFPIEGNLPPPETAGEAGLRGLTRIGGFAAGILNPLSAPARLAKGASTLVGKGLTKAFPAARAAEQQAIRELNAGIRIPAQPGGRAIFSAEKTARIAGREGLKQVPSAVRTPLQFSAALTGFTGMDIATAALNSGDANHATIQGAISEIIFAGPHFAAEIPQLSAEAAAAAGDAIVAWNKGTLTPEQVGRLVQAIEPLTGPLLAGAIHGVAGRGPKPLLGEKPSDIHFDLVKRGGPEAAPGLSREPGAPRPPSRLPGRTPRLPPKQVTSTRRPTDVDLTEPQSRLPEGPGQRPRPVDAEAGGQGAKPAPAVKPRQPSAAQPDTTAGQPESKQVVRRKKPGEEVAPKEARAVAELSRRPIDRIVPTIESKGSDGKWYRGGFPAGVTTTGETRSTGFVLEDKNGVRYGIGGKTEQEIIDRHNKAQDKAVSEFEEILTSGTRAEFDNQKAFWEKKAGVAPAVAAAAAEITADEQTVIAPTRRRVKKKTRRTKKLLSVEQISDFRPGIDTVERRGDRMFVVDSAGERADVEVKPDTLTPGIRANFSNLLPDQVERMRKATQDSATLSPEGKAERLALFDKPTPSTKNPTREEKALRQRLSDLEAKAEAKPNAPDAGAVRTEIGEIKKQLTPGFKPDPTVDKAGEPTFKRQAFASTKGPPPTPVIQKPFLDLQRTKSPDPGIEAFFERTNRLKSVKNKLRAAVAAVKTGLRERFVFAPRLISTPEAAPARDMIRTMPEGQRAAATRATSDVSRILDGDGSRQQLDNAGLELLRKKVFTEDLLQEAERARTDEQETGSRLPKGVTEEALKAEKKRIDELIAKVPSVKDAFETRQQIWSEVSKDLARRGVITEAQADNQIYVRHFVLDFMQSVPGGGGRTRLQDPFRKYALRRKGTSRDVSTDYLEVELKALRDIRADNAIQDMAEAIGKEYDRASEIEKAAKEQGTTPEKLAAKENLVAWQFKRGNQFYRAQTVSEELIAHYQAESLLDDNVGKAFMIPSSALREATVLGGRRKTFFIPDWLADQLDNLPINHRPGTIVSFTEPAVKALKRWYLRTNPVRYNLRNSFGDAERVWAAGRGSAFADVPAGIRMLLSKRAPDSITFEGRTFSREEVYEKGVELGAYGSSLWLEMGGARTINEFKRFENVSNKTGFRKTMAGLKWPLAKTGELLQGIQDATQFREDILRSAVYLDALRDVKAFREEGQRLRHWAGSQKDIEALAKSDPFRAAAKISRETLVDYGDFTPWENEKLRNGAIFFYSWMKKNATFWPRVAFKATREGSPGKPAVAAARIAGFNAVKWLARVGTAYALLHAFNNRDEKTRRREQALSHHKQWRPHLLLPGGYLGAPTALSDFTEWFGLDRLALEFDRHGRGQITTGEMAKRMMMIEAQAPVNRIFQALTPFVASGPLNTFGLEPYPDVFNTRIVAKSQSAKSWEKALLNILGTDVKNFIRANNGRVTWREALSYYFSGSSYQPMEVADLEERLLRVLNRTTLKVRQKRQPVGSPRKGKEAEAQDAASRFEGLTGETPKRSLRNFRREERREDRKRRRLKRREDRKEAREERR